MALGVKVAFVWELPTLPLIVITKSNLNAQHQKTDPIGAVYERI